MLKRELNNIESANTLPFDLKNILDLSFNKLSAYFKTKLKEAKYTDLCEFSRGKSFSCDI
jgi:hypothetical protein